jgi:polyhydroxybutyrate depolymerase
MKKILSIFIIGLLLGCSFGMQGFSKQGEDLKKQITPGDHFRFIMVDGRIRSYQIHIPHTYNGKEPVPLIISLHGHTGGWPELKFGTKLDEKSDEEGFIVVYPTGHLAPLLERILLFVNTLMPTLHLWGHLWNCWDYCDIDDVGFIRFLINHLDSTLNIDSSRIYITGMSGGGMMTYRLGADLSDIVAAIAPVAGSIGGIWYTESTLYIIPKPAHPVSVIVFHGLQDRNLPYAGGWVNGTLRLLNTNIKMNINIYFLSVNESVSFWVEHNNCNPISENETSVSGNIIKQTYAKGDDGSEVILYTVVNGGHEWFGGPEAFWPPCEISATDLMWEFFEAHPKQ